MSMEDALLEEMRQQANKLMIERIKDGTMPLDNEVIPAFLCANLISNKDILDVLEAMADLIMEETMEKEYVIFFLNKVREIANKERSF